MYRKGREEVAKDRKDFLRVALRFLCVFCDTYTKALSRGCPMLFQKFQQFWLFRYNLMEVGDKLPTGAPSLRSASWIRRYATDSGAEAIPTTYRF